MIAKCLGGMEKSIIEICKTMQGLGKDEKKQMGVVAPYVLTSRSVP